MSCKVKYSPCEHCPFRNDIRPFISAGRVIEIMDSLKGGAVFPCHKTVNHDNRDINSELFCAGALILLEKNGGAEQNQMVRILDRLHMIEFDKLDMNAPIYDTELEMIQAHRREDA